MALNDIQKDELQKWSVELSEEEASIKLELKQKREDTDRALMRINILHKAWMRVKEGERSEQAATERDRLIKELEAFESRSHIRLQEIRTISSELEEFLIRNT